MSVHVVAGSHTAYGDHVASGVTELFSDAVRGMETSLGDKADPERIDAAFIGSLSAGQGMQIGNLAPALIDAAGLPPLPAAHVENACASGGFAFQAAVRAVASGQYRCVLAGGVEKMRDVSGDRGRYWLGISGDTEYERLAGMTFAGLFAIIAMRLIHDGVCTREDLARIAAKNHEHATRNPDAHLGKAVTIEQVLEAPLVASPLGVYDCCPTSDGAAVVLVADEETAGELTDRSVEVLGCGAAGDTLAVHSRPDITRLDGTARAADAAYREAGISPDDIDLVELHDCFTPSEIVNLIELGFCSPADVAVRLRAGEFHLGGRLPVNVDGGLKAKGHPIGATGVGQIVELFHQLRADGSVGSRQVDGARLGLAHNMGGSGAAVAVSVLRGPR